MKILLAAINAKYVHTSLALGYLYYYCREESPDLSFREFNINQDLDWVFGEIMLEKADVVAFSCNIWNIEFLKIIGPRLKLMAPERVIILGGPEVWDEPAEFMREQPWADFLVVGEGEETFREWLVEYKKTASKWGGISGLVYRAASDPVVNPAREAIADLGNLPFPYPADLEPFRKKLVYYETSRGCPNHCQYCLSANERGVRFFPLERVKADLLRFIRAEIAQVKFVDRSFNCNPEWAKEIWRFLIAHAAGCVTNFHFEIVGDLLDEESLAILKIAPRGLFQFEVGVQSTNPETLRLIQRRMDFERLADRIGRLLENGNVFVHLDLIAGLPGEDYASFAKTCDDNLKLWPDRLQLGFLKLLKGSGLRSRVTEYGYRFTAEAPYEVLISRWISYFELLRLKTIEDLLERYYNSGRFRTTFRYLLPRFPTPFTCFEYFADWWKERGFDQVAHKSKDLYGYLVEFGTAADQDRDVLCNLVKYDLLLQERLMELPPWAGSGEPELREISYRFWQNEANRAKYVPEFRDLTVREIQRRTLMEAFALDPERVTRDPRDPIGFERVVQLFVYEGKKTRTIRLKEGVEIPT